MRRNISHNGHSTARGARIAVIGAGHVGLVVSACLAKLGCRVRCMDVDAARIEALAHGKVPFYEPGLAEAVIAGLASGSLAFTTRAADAVAGAGLVFMAVGTPQGLDGVPDMRYVFSAARAVGESATGPCTLVLKSTVPVGTARRVKAALKSTGCGNVRVIVNPEFLREGQAIHDFLEPDRVVIGTDYPEDAGPLAALYASFIGAAPVLIMDIASAEMAKHASNAFLATKLSFVNEVAALCDAAGADVEMVRQAVGLDHRIGKAYMAPGLGYGGSCLPKDLRALEALGEEHRLELQLLAAVKRVNAEQPARFVERIVERFSGSVNERRLAVWGLAFKPGTDDVRESPAIAVVRRLVACGASISAYDPRAIDTARAVLGDSIEYMTDMYSTLRGADALVVATEWDECRDADLTRVRGLLAQPIVFDGRNIFDPARMRDLGFDYHSVGRTGWESPARARAAS